MRCSLKPKRRLNNVFTGFMCQTSSSPHAPRRHVRAELTPLQRALGLLTRREHSRRELTRKLKLRGGADDEIEQAVARLAAEGWQSDQRFADNLLHARANAGYGPRYIRAELATHHLSSETIETTFQRFEGDWLATATALLQRRFTGKPCKHDPKQRRKAIDLLTRRGFDRNCIEHAIHYAMDD